MKMICLALLTSAFAISSIFVKPSVISVDAQSFEADDWSLFAPNGADPWTQKEGEKLVNTNQKWFPANFLMNNNSIGLNRTDDGRLSYQVKTKFKSEKTLDDLQTAQWRGVVLFYLNDNNWLSAGTKWDKGQTTARIDTIEMSEVVVYGRINGSFYQTWGTSSWQSIEWNDMWADGNQMHITDETELIVQYTPALDGATINTDTDAVKIIVNSGTKTINKTQRLRSLSDASYFDLASNIDFMSTGLFSINVDAVTSDSVSFSEFEYTPIKPVFDAYIKNTEGFVNSSYSLPSVTASTVLEEGIVATPTVKDPDNLDVAISTNKFTPTKVGDYVVTYTAKDKYNTSITDSYVVTVSSGFNIIYSGDLVTSGIVGDEISLPTFYVEDHPEFDINVKVTDPNGNDVAITNNKFIASLGGDYTVRASSTTPNVAPFEYDVAIKGFYQIKEDGTRITSGTLGDKIVIPSYYIEDHDEIAVHVTITNPLDTNVTLYNNAFSASQVGTYKVDVTAEPGNYTVDDIHYEIIIKDIEIDDGGEENPQVPDPNANNYGYGTRSSGIYFLLGGIGLGVASISVGGYFLAKYLIGLKKRKDK